MDGTVLLADDDAAVRMVLAQALTRAGCKVHATSMLTTLVRWAREGRGDLVISDVVMPDGSGLESLKEIREFRPKLPVIVISAKNTMATAIEAEESDAFAYLPKPFDLPDLLKKVSQGLEFKKKTKPRRVPPVDPEELPLIGRSRAFQAVYLLLAKVMNTDIPVQIFGESGSGKTLVANMVHEHGDRRSLPLISAGSALLGDPDAAASVFVRARGGSVLIDEIAELAPDAQLNLVRAIDAQSGEAARLISTSQFDIGALAERGEFRKDLFFRVSGLAVHLPPLRERLDDIPLLVDHFLRLRAREGSEFKSFSEEALDALRAYKWPGNVRQLERLVGMLIVVGANAEIDGADVKALLAGQPMPPDFGADGSGGIFGGEIESQLRAHFESCGGGLPAPGLHMRVLREVEGPLFRLSLEAAGGNRARCAEMLGINRNTLRKKMREQGIRSAARGKLA